MKRALISATSFLALFASAGGAARAAAISTAPVELNLYDLVRDGVTSSDGGDATVAREDLAISAVRALQSANSLWREPTFTGKFDRAVPDGAGIPATPMNAAAGTVADEDLASSAAGSEQWSIWQKARAIGLERIAPLIGVIGATPALNEKPGGSVFLVAGYRPRFNDASGPRTPGSPPVKAFAPSSTSTASITVPGGGSPRQASGSWSVAANDTQAATGTTTEVLASATRPDAAAQPEYIYTPVRNNVGKTSLVAASFSDAVSATGDLARVVPLMTMAKPPTAQTQPGPGRPAPKQALNATKGSGVVTVARTMPGIGGSTSIEGTRADLSNSVSSDPSITAARYMATIVATGPVSSALQSIETFQVGPSSGLKTRTIVSEPLRKKTTAGPGALNNPLALP
jgi:hypothetical protein